MKKLILITAVLLLTSIQLQAQWFFGNKITGNAVMESTTKNVGNYDKVSVSGSFNVTLIKGEEGKLKIKIEENLLEYLVTEVDNNKLIIKWKKGVNISSKKDVYITVPFTDINTVSLFGSGEIISVDEIETTQFETYLSGSGDMNLTINSKSTKVNVTGSGDIVLKGNTNKITIDVTGSGDVNTYNLKAKIANTKVTGSGDIMVYVSEKLTAKVTGSGDIIFDGNPSKQNFKITGSGDINAK